MAFTIRDVDAVNFEILKYGLKDTGPDHLDIKDSNISNFNIRVIERVANQNFCMNRFTQTLALLFPFTSVIFITLLPQALLFCSLCQMVVGWLF